MTWVKVITLACWVGIALLLFKLTVLVGSNPIPFDTDEADHANAALELYRSFFINAPLSWQAITRQAFYPPLTSFFVSATYAFFGPGIIQSRLCSIFQFAISLVLLFALVRTATAMNRPAQSTIAQSGNIGLIAACFSLLLLATSPVMILNSILTMLEPTGVLMVTILMCYLAKPNGWLIPQAIIIFLVFLSKYSFGIVVLPAVVSALFFATELKTSERFRQSLFLGLLTGIFVAIWVGFTDRAAMWHFFVGHPSYAPVLSQENLTYDIKNWLFHYSINPFISVLVVALGIFAVRNHWSILVVRAAAFIILFGFIILTISTTNEIRHLLMIAPAAFFLGGLGLADFCRWGFQRNHKLTGGLVLLLFILIGAGSIGLSRELDHKVLREFEGKIEYLTLQNFIVDNIEPSQPVLVAGNFDSFSLESLRYLAALKSGLRYTDVRIDAIPFSERKNNTARLRKRNIAHPFLDPSFKPDLVNALNSGYYRYAVQIKYLPKQHLPSTGNMPIFEALSHTPYQTMVASDVRVMIFQLERPIS